MEKVSVFSDGAARNNPGPAGAGVVIKHGGKTVAEVAEYLGKTTNNIAEYKAVEGEGIPLSNFLKANEIIAVEAKQANDQGKSVVVDGNFYHKEQIDQLVAEERASWGNLNAGKEQC